MQMDRTALLCVVLAYCVTLAVQQTTSENDVDPNEHKHANQNVTVSPQTSLHPISPARIICDENEVFAQCRQTCPKTCDTIQPRFCTQMCRQGCDCRPNYYRNRDGRCVPLLVCLYERSIRKGIPPPVYPYDPTRWFRPIAALPVYQPEGSCPPNMVIDDCANFCVATCSLPNRVCPPYSPLCRRGCRCAHGHVENKEGVCVPVDEC